VNLNKFFFCVFFATAIMTPEIQQKVHCAEVEESYLVEEWWSVSKANNINTAFGWYNSNYKEKKTTK
jgi:hypothetical protein